jgi:hypothetical protein
MIFWGFALPPLLPHPPRLPSLPLREIPPSLYKKKAASCPCHGYRRLVASDFFLQDPAVYSASAQTNSWRCTLVSPRALLPSPRAISARALDARHFDSGGLSQQSLWDLAARSGTRGGTAATRGGLYLLQTQWQSKIAVKATRGNIPTIEGQWCCLLPLPQLWALVRARLLLAGSCRVFSERANKLVAMHPCRSTNVASKPSRTIHAWRLRQRNEAPRLPAPCPRTIRARRGWRFCGRRPAVPRFPRSTFVERQGCIAGCVTTK